MMENENYTHKEEIDEEDNPLRKYSLSPFTVVGTIIGIALLWEFTYTSLNYVGWIIVFLLSIFTGLYPVRIKAHFTGNEFSLDDFPMVIGLCLLDPFQLSTAFACGISVAYFLKKVSLKRIFLNWYCNIAVASIASITVQAPLNRDTWYFSLLVIVALLIYYVIDTISFYLVCKFPAKEIIIFLRSQEKMISMVLGTVLGIPAVLMMEYSPAYSTIIFVIFCVACVSFNLYNNLLVSKEQFEQIVNFMTDTADMNTIENSESRLIEMTKSTFRHDSVRIQTKPPKEGTQIGRVIYSDASGDHWLIIDKYDFSKSRLKEDEQLLTNIVAASKRAFEHKELQEQLFKAARHDPLTGLYNRSTLEEFFNHELGLVKRQKTNFSLMFIDLDKFKPINDQFGHRAGDELLKCIARRLTLTVRTQDVVARIGGDEFVILCRDISPEEALDLAARISVEVSKPVFLDSLSETENRLELTVGASIGISNAPEDGISFEKLLKVADTRMYGVKKSSTMKKLA